MNNCFELARNMFGADSFSWFIVCHKVPRDRSNTFPMFKSEMTELRRLEGKKDDFWPRGSEFSSESSLSHSTSH